jgi:hypothetical protein
MTFANPLALFFLAFIPLIILLHSRKTRWKRLEVPSLQLWDRAPGSSSSAHRISTPLWSAILILQILAVAALALALAQPVVKSRAPAGRGDTILILDVTASMQTREEKGSRYDEAKGKALEVLDSLRKSSQMMIIEAGRTPRLVLPFAADRATIQQAIQDSAATDEAGSLEDSILLATSLRGARLGSGIVVVTDGAFDSMGDLDLSDADATLIPVGTQRRNVGITSFQFRRTFMGKEDFELFASVQNFTPSQVLCSLMVSVGSKPVIRTRLSLAPGQSLPLSFPWGGPTDGRATAEIDADDDFPTDNRAYAFFTPARRLSVLLVGPGNYFLESALGVLPNIAVNKTSAEEYSSNNPSAARYDLVVIDGGEPPVLGSGNFVLLNAIPPNLPIRVTGIVGNPRSIRWDASHPLMASLNLKNLLIRDALRLDTQPEVITLVRSEETPLILAYEQEGSRMLVLGFDLRSSDFPLRPAFPVFLANALSWFSPAWLSVQSEQIQVGAPAVLPLIRGTQQLSIERPDGVRESFPVSGSVFTFFGTSRAGFYRVENGSSVTEFAATLTDPSESRIEPRFVMPRHGDSASTSLEVPPIAYLGIPLWRVFIFIALLILLCELLVWTVQKQ